VRPDVAAFRELELLVRHLSDQLAGYRRRALGAEARVRELEHRTQALEGALTEARAQAVVQAPVPIVLPSAGDARLEAENRQLRQRLADARERTGVLVERVRFVRQAAGQGGER
jgi:hypothetical protein